MIKYQNSKAFLKLIQFAWAWSTQFYSSTYSELMKKYQKAILFFLLQVYHICYDPCKSESHWESNWRMISQFYLEFKVFIWLENIKTNLLLLMAKMILRRPKGKILFARKKSLSHLSFQLSSRNQNTCSSENLPFYQVEPAPIWWFDKRYIFLLWTFEKTLEKTL